MAVKKKLAEQRRLKGRRKKKGRAYKNTHIGPGRTKGR
ncbi:MAG: hypothetical protein UX26_C0025G0011 [Parcubacteria group bacterium GW2011_GWC1_45_9]|nr:MAG: hypothetical protein UX26_C0025G0011 [Parcubacteria group bacterium GW2011_GWC1_45_9]